VLVLVVVLVLDLFGFCGKKKSDFPLMILFHSLDGESLNVLTRCGLRSLLFQSLYTLPAEIPTSLAMERTLQRPWPAGG